MSHKWRELQKKMEEYAVKDVCLAFSGGVDSSLLLKAACDAAERTGHKVYAVTFETKLHPPCDLEIATRVAREMGAVHEVIVIDELEQEEIRHNPPDRCYLCKKQLFTRLKALAKARNAEYILDGTNEDDLHTYRPGIKALKELGVISPLASLHFTKAEVKAIAAEVGISVADRPSTPCLATRLPYRTPINYEILKKIGEGEAYIREMIGGNVRLRLHGDVARIEVDGSQLRTVLEHRAAITGKLKKLGFLYVALDLEGFRSGSMDAGIAES